MYGLGRLPNKTDLRERVRSTFVASSFPTAFNCSWWFRCFSPHHLSRLSEWLMLLQLLQPSRMQMASGGSYIALWWEFFHGGDILDVYVPPREYVRSFQPPVDTFPTWTNSLPSLNYKLFVTYWILPLTFTWGQVPPGECWRTFLFLQEYSDVSNLPHNADRPLFSKDFEYANCNFRLEHLFADFFSQLIFILLYLLFWCHSTDINLMVGYKIMLFSLKNTHFGSNYVRSGSIIPWYTS